MEIKRKIGEWYLANKRSLPWRETKDPYTIWVSEIILQQTRVAQGMDYYHRFLGRFPDLESLARAEEYEVLNVWEGLGYYSRARNMHEAAKHIYNNLDGNFPSSYSGILELKGAGRYTAAAVASIAFGEPRAVVDGNVHRVLSRLFGIEEAPGFYGKSSRIVREADKFLDTEDPGTHNQAVMELGAMICTPSQPDCRVCPIREHCIAHLQNRTADLPLRSSPAPRRKRYFHYLLISNENGIWIGHRKKKDIWQGLYELPLIETSRPVSPSSMTKSDEWSSLLGRKGVAAQKVSHIFKHLLTHQEIHARFYHIRDDDLNLLPLSGYKKLGFQDLKHFPFPKLISNYLDLISD
ncbi:A/G-specific adenine glycosylase [Bacteroidota bacterium]